MSFLKTPQGEQLMGYFTNKQQNTGMIEKNCPVQVSLYLAAS